MIIKRTVVLLAALLVVLGFSMHAQATIMDGGVTYGNGSFIKLSVPFLESTPDNTVGNNNFQNNNLYGFDEGQNILVTTNLSVNDLADGAGGGSGSGIISNGTVVASHYIFFDPLYSAAQRGYVNFDSDILGVISSTRNLADSDFLINTGVNYLNPTLRGLESGDFVTITGLQQISVDWVASSPGDYIRVLTAYSPAATTVPEPGTLLLLGSGLMGLGFIRRRFKA